MQRYSKKVKGFDSAETNEKIAVLLPLTSRNSEIDKQLIDLKELIQSFPRGITSFYVGVDSDDPYYSLSLGNTELEDCFKMFDATFKIQEFPAHSPPNICYIARKLAATALSDGCFYFVLLGDDVKIKTSPKDIPVLLRKAFQAIAERAVLPYGFGCVAFHDETSVGFPTFPVVTRVHFDIFDQWCPDEFINQDADPYLFELYRRFSAAIIDPKLILRNEIGGAGLQTPFTRYEKQHIHWQDKILKDGVETIKQKFPNAKTCVRLDIVVPSFRVPEDYLRRIIELPVPENCSTTVIIIIDNPNDANALQLRNVFEEEYRDKVRIRMNEENRGASYTRSRGLDESAADWILFLDDDVIPSEDLLSVYVQEIVATGHLYAGYVGATRMPEAKTMSTKGIHLVHLLHFWSDHVSSGREFAPWGITAQLVLKRTEHRFNEIFPKTGGGEDIDLCLRTCETLGLKLKNLPAAICTHPWWNDGHVHISRFYGWSKGDALLVDLYPQHCYRSFPNGLETMLFLSVGYVLLRIYGSVYASKASMPTLMSFFGSLVLTFCVDVGFELLHIMSANDDQPTINGLERLICGLYGTVWYRFLGADVGHVLSPFLRGDIAYHLCLRFDWWCGLYPEEKNKILMKEAIRFSLMMAALFIWMGRM